MTKFVKHLISVYATTEHVVEDAESKGIYLEDVLPVMPRRHLGDFIVNVFYVVISLRRDFHISRLKNSIRYLWLSWKSKLGWGL